MKRFLFGLLFLLFTIHFSLFTSSYAAEPPKRIISLAPNMTEILFALGLGDRIVGVTSFCDYPEEAKKKPKIGGMSNPSLEAVVRLRPDIVVMTTDGNPKEFEERLRSMGIKTYVSTARRLSELPQGVRDLGVALGVRAEADAFADRFEASLAKFRVKRALNGHAGKKVLYIVWPEPLIVAGPETVVDDALSLVGAENIASDAKTEYPKYSVEEVLRRSPDLIIIGKGMDSKDVKQVADGLLGRLRSLSAVKHKRVFYVSDDLYRLGPRTINGIGEISPLVNR
jgi:iron complex transport system substrate-binding protein